VRTAEELLHENTTLVISGDILTDFDLTKAVEFHRAKNAMATMVLTHVENPLAYGVVITEKDGRIVRFLEKPSWGEVFSDAVNTGIYILEPEVFDLVPKDSAFDFSKDLFPLMLERKLPLYGHIADGYWRDVGNLLEYRLAHKDILKGEVEVDIPGSRKSRIGKDFWAGEGTEVERGVQIKDAVILGKRCRELS
jgi:mannose-1-phosphate guanylyltransferase/phosphomannomutase